LCCSSGVTAQPETGATSRARGACFFDREPIPVGFEFLPNDGRLEVAHFFVEASMKITKNEG
jgi:hypothetical protein